MKTGSSQRKKDNGKPASRNSARADATTSATGSATTSARSAVAGRSRQTRQEQLDQRRVERQRAEQAQQRRRLFTRIGLWGGGVVIVALIIAAIVHSYANQPYTGSIAGVVTYSNLARTHVSGTVKYPQNPPVGGPHASVWLNCGVYDAPVANENAVHSMEHGAVWITYQPSLSSSAVAHLKSLVQGHSYVILSPYTGLPAPVVASAWGVQLKLSSATDARLPKFISKYEQGPQTPEQGAACSGGVGTPNS